MGKGMVIKGTVSGVAEITAKLKGLPGKLQRKIVRPALQKATKPVVAAVRANAPKDSGLLKKSIGRKTATSKNKSAVTSIIGPRRGYKQEVVRRGRKKATLADPVRYAHLVDLGTKRGVSARKFMQRAYDETQGTVQTTFASEVESKLESVVKE